MAVLVISERNHLIAKGIVVRIRIAQEHPSGAHRAVLAQVICVVVHPARLHNAFGIKEIIFSVYLGPSVCHGFSAVGKIIPYQIVLLIPVRILDRQLHPLVGHHDAVVVNVIIVVRPGVYSHNALAV